MLATIKYDFEIAQYIVFLDENANVQGSGDSIKEALDNLRFQANKHDLWPKR